MRRRRHEEEHENHERWLVSYADFITLLFAFFVVMYAISQVSEGKYRVLSDSLLQAFKPSATSSSVVPVPDPRSTAPLDPISRIRLRHVEQQRREREERMKIIAQKVMQALSPLVQTGQVRITQSSRGIAVEINASMLFQSAQATLEPGALQALNSVAQVLAQSDNALEVEGHTDRDPINTALFPSNWELSGARASSVVRLFIDNGLAPYRMAAVGYADTRPVETNETAEGRSRNRRVTVLIRPEKPGELLPDESAPLPATAPESGQGAPATR